MGNETSIPNVTSTFESILLRLIVDGPTPDVKWMLKSHTLSKHDMEILISYIDPNIPRNIPHSILLTAFACMVAGCQIDEAAYIILLQNKAEIAKKVLLQKSKGSMLPDRLLYIYVEHSSMEMFNEIIDTQDYSRCEQNSLCNAILNRKEPIEVLLTIVDRLIAPKSIQIYRPYSYLDIGLSYSNVYYVQPLHAVSLWKMGKLNNNFPDYILKDIDDATKLEIMLKFYDPTPRLLESSSPIVYDWVANHIHPLEHRTNFHEIGRRFLRFLKYFPIKKCIGGGMCEIFAAFPDKTDVLISNNMYPCNIDCGNKPHKLWDHWLKSLNVDILIQILDRGMLLPIDLIKTRIHALNVSKYYILCHYGYPVNKVRQRSRKNVYNRYLSGRNKIDNVLAPYMAKDTALLIADYCGYNMHIPYP